MYRLNINEPKHLLLLSVIFTVVLWMLFHGNIIPHSLYGITSDIPQLTPFNPECVSDRYCCSLGYPFIQSVFLFFSDNVSMFLFLQVFLFSFSCVYLSYEFFKLANNKILSMLLFLSIYLNPKVFKYSFTTTEEGIFLSLIAISTALIIRFGRKKILTQLYYYLLL